jgi:superfamily II DNA/RNA helicase
MFDTQSEIQDDQPEPRIAAICFADLGFSSHILRALYDQEYAHPTSVQKQSIPAILRGCDLVCVAQTGTGKTASFLLPLIQTLLPSANTSASPARHPVRALILAPTRELAHQVSENTKAYCKYTLLRSTVLFGGVDITPQISELNLGAEIVIATPGRLLDHVQQKTLNLSQVQILVLDEADRMLDMGFLPDLQRITRILPKLHQSLMFSATFSDQIKKLASNFLNNPIMIEVKKSNLTANNVAQIDLPG